MKKKFTLLLAAIITATMVTGCGGTSGNSSSGETSDTSTAGTTAQDTDNSTGKETAQGNTVSEFKIGFAYPSAGTAATEVIAANVDEMAAEAGGSMLYATSWDASADGVLTTISNHIAAGADGVVVLSPADSVMPSIVKLCEESEIYFSMSMRDIADTEIREMVMASPYYAGGICEKSLEAGYQMGTYLGEKGYKQIALVSAPVGTFATDQREIGLQQACEEFDMEIVSEVRGLTQVSEAADAANSFLAAYPDLDVIVDVGDYIEGVTDILCSTIADSGKDVKVTSFVPALEPEKTMDTGVMELLISDPGSGGTYYDIYMATAKVINAVKGSPIVNGEGNEDVSLMPIYSTSDKQEFADFCKFITNPDFRYYSTEDIHKLFAWENPDLDEATFVEYMENYSIYTHSPTYR